MRVGDWGSGFTEEEDFGSGNYEEGLRGIVLGSLLGIISLGFWGLER